jgi:hypothetical protein
LSLNGKLKFLNNTVFKLPCQVPCHVRRGLLFRLGLHDLHGRILRHHDDLHRLGRSLELIKIINFWLSYLVDDHRNRRGVDLDFDLDRHIRRGRLDLGRDLVGRIRDLYRLYRTPFLSYFTLSLKISRSNEMNEEK